MCETNCLELDVLLCALEPFCIYFLDLLIQRLNCSGMLRFSPDFLIYLIAIKNLPPALTQEVHALRDDRN